MDGIETLTLSEELGGDVWKKNEEGKQRRRQRRWEPWWGTVVMRWVQILKASSYLPIYPGQPGVVAGVEWEGEGEGGVLWTKSMKRVQSNRVWFSGNPFPFGGFTRLLVFDIRLFNIAH